MKLRLACPLACLLYLAQPAAAQTVAYWRFEDNAVADQPVPNPGGNGGAPYSPYLADSSGNNNQLRTFADFSAPTWRANVPFAAVPQTGAANNYALDFIPNRDLYTLPGGNTLDGLALTNFTVEASFRPRDLNRFHGIVGKDGQPTASPLAPLQLKLRDDTDRFQIELLDSGGSARSVQSINAPQPDQWYYLATVSDGTELRFYVKGPGDPDYVLQDAIATAGGLVNSTGTWTVGRGFFSNAIGDWSNGLIDEVRISSVALAPSQFLATPVPEPAHALFAAAVVAGVWRRVRRRQRPLAGGSHAR